MYIMWIVLAFVASMTMPYVVLKVTQRYADRCVENSKQIIESRLREYETIAAQYTKNGTPEELRSLMNKMEELADDLQVLEDNNPFKREA
jgi:uncharacterized membrane protein YgaE (UPF0421/DUF939 family)|eukprot:COSAG03_NODE_448_length_7836_cov_82.194649_4_plen_90_part_00